MAVEVTVGDEDHQMGALRLLTGELIEFAARFAGARHVGQQQLVAGLAVPAVADQFARGAAQYVALRGRRRQQGAHQCGLAGRDLAEHRDMYLAGRSAATQLRELPVDVRGIDPGLACLVQCLSELFLGRRSGCIALRRRLVAVLFGGQQTPDEHTERQPTEAQATPPEHADPRRIGRQPGLDVECRLAQGQQQQQTAEAQHDDAERQEDTKAAWERHR
jgi:hypothetical protein